jgi:sirohydrochlorin ferrochelatase
MSATRSSAPKAPATEPVWQDAALVLCAHGIRGGAGVAAAHAAAIARLGLFAEVRACAHKGRPGLIDTLAAVRGSSVYLLPLLMAEGFTLRAILARLEAADTRGAHLRVCPPLGTHPGLSALLAREAEAAAARAGWDPAATALLITGHGTTRHALSSASTREHAAAIAAQGLFAEVAIAFLDQPPTIAETVTRLAAPRCIAVGLFVDRGEHGEEDIPALLAATGREALYTGPVGCDPAIVDLILDQVRAADRQGLAA